MLTCKCFCEAIFHDVIIIVEYRGIVRKPVVLIQASDFLAVYTKNFMVGKIEPAPSVVTV